MDPRRVVPPRPAGSPIFGPPAFRGGYNARGTSGRQDRANRLRAPTLAVSFETAVIGPPPGLLRGSHPMRISYPRCASVAPQVFDRPPVGEQPYGTGPSPRCRAHL